MTQGSTVYARYGLRIFWTIIRVSHAQGKTFVKLKFVTKFGHFCVKSVTENFDSSAATTPNRVRHSSLSLAMPGDLRLFGGQPHWLRPSITILSLTQKKNKNDILKQYAYFTLL